MVKKILLLFCVKNGIITKKRRGRKMTRAEKAKELFEKGYACSQAVAMAFADEVGVDASTLEKITLPFGGGFGRLRLTCGAVSGMAAIYGLAAPNSGALPENKKAVYAGTRELAARFEKENGSIVCAELLASKSFPVVVGGETESGDGLSVKKRTCAELVYNAAEILENYLKEQGLLKI